MMRCVALGMALPALFARCAASLAQAIPPHLACPPAGTTVIFETMDAAEQKADDGKDVNWTYLGTDRAAGDGKPAICLVSERSMVGSMAPAMLRLTAGMGAPSEGFDTLADRLVEMEAGTPTRLRWPQVKPIDPSSRRFWDFLGPFDQARAARLQEWGIAPPRATMSNNNDTRISDVIFTQLATVTLTLHVTRQHQAPCPASINKNEERRAVPYRIEERQANGTRVRAFEYWLDEASGTLLRREAIMVRVQYQLGDFPPMAMSNLRATRLALPPTEPCRASPTARQAWTRTR